MGEVAVMILGDILLNYNVEIAIFIILVTIICFIGFRLYAKVVKEDKKTMDINCNSEEQIQSEEFENKQKTKNDVAKSLGISLGIAGGILGIFVVIGTICAFAFGGFLIWMFFIYLPTHIGG